MWQSHMHICLLCSAQYPICLTTVKALKKQVLFLPLYLDMKHKFHTHWLELELSLFFVSCIQTHRDNFCLCPSVCLPVHLSDHHTLLAGLTKQVAYMLNTCEILYKC